jgi:cytochrome c
MRPNGIVPAVLAAAAIALGVACTRERTAAAPEHLGLGRPATAAEIAAVDLEVDPSGHGLPAGRGTVDEGAAVYAAKCASCHGAQGEGRAAYPKLVQPVAAADSFPFDRDFKIPKTVGNYWPYATTLYDYLRHTMPYDRPGSLTPNETYALVAWLLAENGVVARTAVMDARSLPAVALPARRHFVPDDRRGGGTFR